MTIGNFTFVKTFPRMEHLNLEFNTKYAHMTNNAHLCK